MVVMPRFRRSLRITAGALGGSLGFVVLAAIGTDHLVGAAYRHWKPQLERSLSAVLNQPLHLGPYQGLRPWGLRLGASRLAPTATNRSSAAVGAVDLKLAPLASLRQGSLTLHIGLRQSQLVLRPNARGAYWQPGPRQLGARPPRLDLLVQLEQPARVQLQPTNSRLQLAGNLRLQPHLKQLALRAVLRADPPQGHGSVHLQAQGRWSQNRWQGRLQLRQLRLAQLLTLLPGDLAAQVGGSLNGDLALTWRQGQVGCQGLVELQNGRWQGRPAPRQPAQPRPSLEIPSAKVRCEGQQITLAPSRIQWGSWAASTSLRARWPQLGRLEINTLELRRAGSWLKLNGSIAQVPKLSSRWQLRPADLPGGQRLPAWLQQSPLSGSLTLAGQWRQPQLTLTAQRSADPLLGPWRAALAWSAGQLRLTAFDSPHLQAQGSLPLGLHPRQGLKAGPLALTLQLTNYPLARLSPLLGTQLGGQLQASGSITGPWQTPTPNLELRVGGLAAGPLSLAEGWQGHWQGAPSGGGLLQLTAMAPAGAGQLEARLDRRWQPVAVKLLRGAGSLALQGRPNAYRWQAQRLPLQGLVLALGPRDRPQPLQGLLSGNGELNLQPLGFTGQVNLDRPVFMGVRARTVQLSGIYGGRRYRLQGSLEPLSSGTMALTAQGRWQGGFQLKLQGRSLDTQTLQELAGLWPQWQGKGLQGGAQARDIGTLLIQTLGDSLQQQLLVLEQSQGRLASREQALASRRGSLNDRLAQVQTLVDADLSLEGPSLDQARVDLASKGHLWLRKNDRDQALAAEPFVAQLQGPLKDGQGNFSFSQLPLGLLALLTPVPDGLRGQLGATGRYRLGRRKPELAVQLKLDDTALGTTPLELKRGAVLLQGDVLKLDLSLLAAGASSSVDLAGLLPLNPSSPGLELRLASRGDGLRFLTAIAEPGLIWRKGSADLQLLLRGSLNSPIANGFLRLREGEIQFIGQRVEALEATVLFDFEQLLVQELKAKVGSKGSIEASGHLGLMQDIATEKPLVAVLRTVPFSLPRITAVADGTLELTGSLLNLQMGGELGIAQGSVNAQRGKLATSGSSGPRGPVKGVAQLLLENWSFSEPLQLVGSEVESNTAQAVQAGVPRFPFLAFNDLRLRIGPNLRIVVPNAANFTTAGLLRLSGRLDPSLRARGVVRLLQGRLNLFTTSFSLDPDSPNVAIFTPSLGLVPYLDIAMRTRVSDSLSSMGLGSYGAPSLAEIEAQGGVSSLNQLNLVLITVSVSGPADRVAQSIRLRSTPPMPESKLVALIGGNSLAGLSGADAGAAIATVLGQTLLSPVLGGLSDAFGQRLSFALYPAYVNPTVTSQEALQSQRLPPQLVLGAEIGIDITERFNASVLAAPNRSDVPPQINLNLRANDLLNLQGTFDTQGAWQTQLQLFFRF